MRIHVGNLRTAGCSEEKGIKGNLLGNWRTGDVYFDRVVEVVAVVAVGEVEPGSRKQGRRVDQAQWVPEKERRLT